MPRLNPVVVHCCTIILFTLFHVVKFSFYSKLTVSEEMFKSLHEVLSNYEVIASVLKTNYKKQVNKFSKL